MALHLPNWYPILKKPADNAVTPVLKLADLVNLYTFSNELKQLGIEVEGRIHSKKLKDRILGYFQDMEAHKQS